MGVWDRAWQIVEPFHAITNQPRRSSVVLAVATPLICIALMVLVASAAHIWHDPGALAALGGFTVVLLAVASRLCLNPLTREEIFIDGHAMLVRRRLGRRVRERTVILAADAHARVGTDTRPKFARGSFTAIRVPTASGKDHLFGGGLNTSDQEALALKINAYFRTLAP